MRLCSETLHTISARREKVKSENTKGDTGVRGQQHATCTPPPDTCPSHLPLTLCVWGGEVTRSPRVYLHVHLPEWVHINVTSPMCAHATVSFPQIVSSPPTTFWNGRRLTPLTHLPCLLNSSGGTCRPRCTRKALAPLRALCPGDAAARLVKGASMRPNSVCESRARSILEGLRGQVARPDRRLVKAVGTSSIREAV